jgi:hypothetical protein
MGRNDDDDDGEKNLFFSLLLVKKRFACYDFIFMQIFGQRMKIFSDLSPSDRGMGR